MKKRATIKKLRAYYDSWDTVQYGYLQITQDGKLLPTNNIDLGEWNLTKADLLSLIQYIDDNTHL